MFPNKYILYKLQTKSTWIPGTESRFFFKTPWW